MTDKKQQFLSNFIGSAPKTEVTQKLAQEALTAIDELEIPTTKDEYWKYTRVGKIINGTYSQGQLIDIASIDDFKLPFECNNLVFVNGLFSEKLSSIKENSVIVESFASAKTKHPELLDRYVAKYADHKTQWFTAVNTAYSTNGVFIYIEKNTSANLPIHIINITSGKGVSMNPRNLIIVDKSAEAKVINSFETIDGDSFINSVSEIVLEENSKMELVIMQNQSATSKQINTTEVYQKSNSKFSAGTFTFSGELIRNNLNISVDGQGCESNLNGLYITKDNQHVDNHTFVDHKQPNCESNELYKGILDNQSTGVFNGKVFVNSIAQQTNAFQQNQNILLSDDSNAFSKPELEIYADDVKCSHGSTTGQFDEEALFYLRSRGIGEQSARKLLVEAFAADVLQIVSSETLQEVLQQKIHEKLG